MGSLRAERGEVMNRESASRALSGLRATTISRRARRCRIDGHECIVNFADALVTQSVGRARFILPAPEGPPPAASTSSARRVGSVDAGTPPRDTRPACRGFPQLRYALP